MVTKGTNVTNYVVGLIPENADGFPDHAEYDADKLEITSTTLGGANDKMSGVDLKGAFGKFTVTVKDERGMSVGSYDINNVPKPVVDICGTGTWNSASVHIGSGNSESTAESSMSKTFTIGTAPGKKTVIKSVKNIRIKKETGTLIHNSGKINEYRTHYTYYAASGKIKTGKVKGASLYEYNIYGTSCPNYSSKTTANLRLVKGGSTAASCKKTLKLQCRVSRKINSYFTAYGPWGKVKKVKVK